MWIFVALFLILAAAVAILWPYLRSRPETTSTVEVDPRLAELYAERDVLYRAVRDVRFDKEMGKLTVEDYEMQSMRIKRQAAAVLRSIDEVEQHNLSPELDASIEADIARIRRTNGRNGHKNNGAMGEALEATIASARRGRVSPTNARVDRFCARCGTAIKAGDRFCSGCGQGVGAG